MINITKEEVDNARKIIKEAYDNGTLLLISNAYTFSDEYEDNHPVYVYKTETDFFINYRFYFEGEFYDSLNSFENKIEVMHLDTSELHKYYVLHFSGNGFYLLRDYIIVYFDREEDSEAFDVILETYNLRIIESIGEL